MNAPKAAAARHDLRKFPLGSLRAADPQAIGSSDTSKAVSLLRLPNLDEHDDQSDQRNDPEGVPQPHHAPSLPQIQPGGHGRAQRFLAPAASHRRL